MRSTSTVAASTWPRNPLNSRKRRFLGRWWTRKISTGTRHDRAPPQTAAILPESQSGRYYFTSRVLTPAACADALTYAMAPLVRDTYATTSTSVLNVFGIEPVPEKIRLR